MNKDSQKEHSFNIVDFFIIAILIFLVCVLVFVILGNDVLDVVSEKNEISYTLVIDESYLSSFPIGAEILNKNGHSMGVVASTTSYQAEKQMLLVNAQSYTADNDIFIKGQLLTEGGELCVRLPDSSVIYATCVSIIEHN